MVVRLLGGCWVCGMVWFVGLCFCFGFVGFVLGFFFYSSAQPRALEIKLENLVN